MTPDITLTVDGKTYRWTAQLVPGAAPPPSDSPAAPAEPDAPPGAQGPEPQPAPEPAEPSGDGAGPGASLRDQGWTRVEYDGDLVFLNNSPDRVQPRQVHKLQYHAPPTGRYAYTGVLATPAANVDPSDRAWLFEQSRQDPDNRNVWECYCDYGLKEQSYRLYVYGIDPSRPGTLFVGLVRPKALIVDHNERVGGYSGPIHEGRVTGIEDFDYCTMPGTPHRTRV